MIGYRHSRQRHARVSSGTMLLDRISSITCKCLETFHPRREGDDSTYGEWLVEV